MPSIRVIPTEFTSETETLRGNFVLPREEGPFPGICKFHGLPGSSDQVSGFASALALAGFAVLTFDFRGFRSSEGYFSLRGEVIDAQQAITHLLDSEYTKKDWVGVYGASYGAAVAVLAAVRDSRINAVCLRAPVYDTLWFAQSPLIQPAVTQLLATSPNEMHGLSNPRIQREILERMIHDAKVLNPIHEVGKIAPRPLLVITGSEDIPIKSAEVQRFFSLANEPKELFIIEGADHNLSNPKAYVTTVETVVAWFKQQHLTKVS